MTSGRPSCCSCGFSGRTGTVAAGIDDTEETEWFPSCRSQLMNLLRPYVDRVHRLKGHRPVSDPNPAATTHPYDDVGVAMAFKAGEAAGFELEVTEMKGDALASLSHQDLP